MGWSGASPALLAGTAAIVATAVAFLHTKRLSERAALAEPEEREEPDDAPKPKRTRTSGPRKNYWNQGWGLMLLLIRERRRRGNPGWAGEATFKSRFQDLES